MSTSSTWERVSLRFLINVLTTNERSGWVHPILNDYLSQLPFMYGLDTQIRTRTVHNHIPAAAARNFVGQQVKKLPLDERPDWVVMIDNDMAPPMNLLETVLDCPEDASVVVPVFHMWDEGKASTIVCWGMENATSAIIAGKKFHELSKAGTGVIFIKPEVFDKLELPYFWYPYNELCGIEGTEDITFCTKVLDNGMKIYGNSQILVGHLHNVNLAVVADAFDRIRARQAESQLEAVASPA